MKRLKCRMCGKVFTRGEIDDYIGRGAYRDFPRCESPEAGKKPFVDSGIGGHLLRDLDVPHGDECCCAACEDCRKETAAVFARHTASGQLDAEIARLTAALHANRCHPDYSYCIVNGMTFGGWSAWERNHEYKGEPGDECWRKKKRSVNCDVFNQQEPK